MYASRSRILLLGERCPFDWAAAALHTSAGFSAGRCASVEVVGVDAGQPVSVEAADAFALATLAERQPELVLSTTVFR
jgi:hypothetical protein